MGNSPPTLEQAALDDCVGQHRRAGLRSALASSVIAVALVAVTWQPAGGLASWGWLAGLVAAQAVRVWLGVAHGRAVPGAADARRWRTRYRAAAALHGIAWALLAAAVLRGGGEAAVMPVSFALAVLVSGSLVVNSFDPVTAAAFATPAAATGLWALAATPPASAQSPAFLAMALALAIVAVHSLVAGRREAAERLADRQADAARRAQSQRHADAAEDARRGLAEQHHMMSLLLRTTDQGYWYIGPDGVTLDVNPAMCLLLGRPREAVIGQPVTGFFEGTALERLRRELALRREGHGGRYEIDIVRPDGSVRHCVNHATPVLDTAGRRIGSVGLWTDITTLREHERALHAYELAMNSVHDIVSVIDEGHHYRLVNDAWCRVTGLTREAVIGRHAESVMPGVYSAARREAFERCLRERQPARVAETAVKLAALEGRRVESTYYPYVDETGVRYVAIVSRDITAQVEHRRQLAEAAEYLERTLNATGDAIFASDASDPNEPVRFANAQLFALWGLPDACRERLTPAQIMAFATPQFEDPEAETRRVERIVADNRADESVLRLRDGRVIARRCVPAQVGGRALRVWSFRDISVETRALEAARAGEAEQRALLDAFPGYIARLDLQRRYTYVNARMAALSGHPPGEIVGRPVGELVGGAAGAQLRATLEQALAGGPMTTEFHYPSSRPGGGTDVQVTLARGVHPGTGVPAVYAFGIDITDRKRAEQSLRASEAELRAVLDAFPGFIVAIDEDLHYRFVNPRMSTLFGRAQADIVGRPASEVLDPERLQTVLAEIAAARGGARPVAERHYPATASRDALDIEITHVAGPLRPDGSRSYYAFGTDITARKRAEEALIAARDEADRANLAKSQFLSQMSHELRTPMNAILGLGQLLVSDPLRPLVPTQQAYVNEMLRGARHLLELINEVLDLGRIEAGQLAVDAASVPLAEVIDECVNLVRPLAQEHQVTLTRPAPSAFHVQADRTRLKQVLLNLLGNAIKYNRRPGSVMVACGPEGDGVRVVVRDTGRGLTADEQQRLFRPFERLGAARSGVEGTGIGLALSRRLVEAMGGRIGVDSEPGEGSCFWVWLPCAEAPAVRAAARRDVVPAQGATPADGAVPVLYIEDNPVNMFVMEALFERLPGHRLVSAATPALGLRIARADPPALILLDVQLPDMDGSEVLRRLKAHEATRDIPVVAVSASAMPSDVDAMLAAGASEYLTKPVDLDRLVDTVRRLAGAR